MKNCDLCVSYGIFGSDLEPVTYQTIDAYTEWAGVTCNPARRLFFCADCACELESSNVADIPDLEKGID